MRPTLTSLTLRGFKTIRELQDFAPGPVAIDIGHRRFIPHIQLHEFEALLFSDVREFQAEFPGNPAAVGMLVAIRNQFQTPEDIDDSVEFAPPVQEDPEDSAGLSEASGRTNHRQPNRPPHTSPRMPAFQSMDRKDRNRCVKVESQ